MDKNIYQLLHDWGELLKSGAITEEEFAAKKKELLGTEQKKEKTIQTEEPVRVLTPEEQAQYDAEYDILFNNQTWFQKNKAWILSLVIMGILVIAILYFTNTFNSTTSSSTFDSTIIQNENSISLPFVGKRWYEFYPLFSGTGTDQHYIRIEPNGDVYFGTFQVDQGSKEEHQNEHYVGKFKTIIRFDDKYYTIHKEEISIIDKDGEVTYDLNCCQESNEYNRNQKCPCESTLSE